MFSDMVGLQWWGFDRQTGRFRLSFAIAVIRHQLPADVDELLPIEGTRNAVARLREAGISIQYYEIRGTHASPTRAGPPEVFRFFEKYKARASGP